MMGKPKTREKQSPSGNKKILLSILIVGDLLLIAVICLFTLSFTAHWNVKSMPSARLTWKKFRRRLLQRLIQFPPHNGILQQSSPTICRRNSSITKTSWQGALPGLKTALLKRGCTNWYLTNLVTIMMPRGIGHAGREASPS